ncbi:MAG: DUF2807 domain-containing protein, partial [Flavobacteriia bacterium]
MKLFIKTIWIGFLVISLTSCAINGIKGNGNVVTKDRVVNSDFNVVDVSRGLDVYLTVGEKISVSVQADENLHDLITTEVRNGTLYISALENIYSAKARKIFVSVPEVNKIKATSGADLYTENTITGNKLVVKATSGADIRLSIDVKDLEAVSTSGSDIKMKGKAENINVSATSGSDIKAYDLIVKNCTAKATSGSDILVHVTENIDASANSGS